MTLRGKLFAAFLLLVIVPICLIGIAAYTFISDTVMKKYSQQAELTLRALRQNVEFVFDEMTKVTDSTIASVALQELLEHQGYRSDLEQLSSIDMLELNAIQKNFRELLISHPSVSYALMYTLDSEKVIPIYVKSDFQILPFEQLEQHPLYKSVRERNARPVWIGPYEYPELTGEKPVYTQMRVVKDIGTLRDKGILLVQIRNSGLENVFRYFRFNQERYDTRFFIVNKEGLILFDSSDEIDGQAVQSFLEKEYEQEPLFRSVRQRFGDTESIVSSVGLSIENWQLVSVTSWDFVSGEIYQYARWAAAVLTLTLLSALAFLLLSLNRIAKKIIRIVRFMRRIEDGDLGMRVEEKGSDELYMLARGLNSMIRRIQHLLERVKEEQKQKMNAEMRVLQTQIKPHFIFNTLESINVLAVQNEGRKVSAMVLRLANILRISFQGREEISLQQEVEHVKSYLEIQRFRFTESFAYSVDIPDELLTCKVQKLTLQPLVENCIQHAFDGLDRTGHIAITARSADGRLILSVKDNGVGIPDAVLAKFRYMASDEESVIGDETQGEHNPERRGLGIRSVADRIRIQYGGGYGLMICSSRDEGTTIQCILPLQGWRDGSEAEGYAG
ncbi:sensor histidine kinase [Paenibacillus sp. J5C_2022]|uniref:cache domain-containing sensor histidine kinase n=1 Tax=Paenibacillus sp. J5C2022 TaxID=2977129 RepID=UPI0021D2BD9E|nr:sensor histidine kinase [Paenibacillus sp. J5C2022]MCU6707900.1 sensor histidine kinase [Paenibacillus sp. J5C2022]